MRHTMRKWSNRMEENGWNAVFGPSSQFPMKCEMKSNESNCGDVFLLLFAPRERGHMYFDRPSTDREFEWDLWKLLVLLQQSREATGKRKPNGRKRRRCFCCCVRWIVDGWMDATTRTAMPVTGVGGEEGLGRKRIGSVYVFVVLLIGVSDVVGVFD